MYQNRPLVLLKIAFMTFVSIFVCPLLLLLYMLLAKTFWPEKYFSEIPNINDGLQSFLIPAGLIYTVQFGFNFQEAFRIQNLIKEHFSNIVFYSHSIVQNCMTSTHLYTKEERRYIINVLKEEVLIWMRQVLAYSHKVVFHVSTIGAIEYITQKTVQRFTKPMDRTFAKKMLRDVEELKRLNNNGLRDLCGTLDTLQWFFLQSLANFTFFGILMVKANSYKYQMAICVITVFSISVFSYILADLDNPYNGYYRVDLSILTNLIDDLHVISDRNKHMESNILLEELVAIEEELVDEEPVSETSM